jgi:hypothetical protein
LRGPAQPAGRVSCSNSILNARPWFSSRRSPLPELALPAQFAPLLLLGFGNANGLLVGVAVEMTRQAHAQFPRIEPIILAPPLGREPHGRGHDRVRAGRDQGMMERVAKAARLIHGVDGVARGHLLLDPVQEPAARELLRQRDRAAITLEGRDDEVQIHIQPQLEDVARGPGRRRDRRYCGIALAGARG